MKPTYIILAALLATLGLRAQTAGETSGYRRSSIYSLLINHEEQKYADEISTAFVAIPVPDRFNDHNLSVKVVTLDKKLKGAKSDDENAAITQFLTDNRVASRLVGRWFNRDFYTGVCDMELVKERGLYNASEFDKALAQRTARGTAMLQDAGEQLIGKTYVLVNDIRYVDKEQKAKVAGGIFRVLGAVASIATGVDMSKTIDNLGDMIESIKGFKVRINTFLYQLDWDEATSTTFYTQYWASQPDEARAKAFEEGRDKFHLTYVGKVESAGSTTSFMGLRLDQPEAMVRKACQRAIDENVVDLQHEYPCFRAFTPLVSGAPITAYIGMKEGLTADSRYEVLEDVENADGTHEYKRVGIVRPTKNLIWDNRYMAVEEGAIGSQLGYTTFTSESGKDFTPGMLLREMDD